MSEAFLLEPVARGTLLEPAARLERLQSALPQLRAVVRDERDPVSVQASLACLLWEVLPHTNWCGFYRRVSDTLLAVVPYQGSLGSLRIPLSRGVCGAAARTGQIQRVDNIHTVTDHIACDARSRSELVIPITRGERVHAVLDLDSPHLAAFSAAEAQVLDGFLRDVFAAVEWSLG